MKLILNLAQLVCVEVIDKKRCNHLDYKAFKKSFWGNRKEGFYTYGSDYPYTKEDVENGRYMESKLFVEDNIVYFYPYVRLRFAGSIDKIRQFKTYDEALKWGDKVGKYSSYERKAQIITDGIEYEIK